MKILGIDPGTLIVGHAAIEVKDVKNIKLIHHGATNVKKIKNYPQRLKLIFEELSELMKTIKPDVVAIEKAFYHKNVMSTLKIGEGRGVALLATAMNDIPVFEYTPTEVKKSVVGSGHADKEQIKYMVKVTLNLKEEISPSDESDAIAIALCHFYNTVNKAF